jgi:hypothetical protein
MGQDVRMGIETSQSRLDVSGDVERLLARMTRAGERHV